jgi:hypothetical protein
MPVAPLDLEERLEDWIALDASILSSDLLVIGRQVEVQGGYIDILCLDASGGLVIVELKRGKTPREVTAQTLDYASSVRQFSNDQIRTIAGKHLGSEVALEQAFEKRFNAELPDVLNGSHRMLVVGTNLDSSTERIISYLSDAHGIDINAVTFGYYRNGAGMEFLSRVFLIEPTEVEYKSRTRSSSKRAPTLTFEELADLATSAGVGPMYMTIVEALGELMKKGTTRSSLRFLGEYHGSPRVVFSLIPGESTQEKGLKFQVYLRRLCEALGLSDEQALQLLPSNRKEWAYPGAEEKTEDWSGYEGFFQSEADVQRFLKGLRRSAGGRT